jgi:putative nucleotidyltransferase with HDIG domain
VPALSGTSRDCGRRILQSLDRLPPVSLTLNRLIASLAREEVSFTELSALIESDTVLAGKVLSVANSAMYGLPSSVTSVRRAAAMIGLLKLRNFILSLSISKMWRPPTGAAGWSSALFNRHSVAVAIGSDVLAGQVPVNFPEGAFAAGLFHDLGKLLIAISAPEEYSATRARFRKGLGTLVECEREVLGTTHAELSAAALERWKLPEAICQAVLHHHAPVPDHTGKQGLDHIVHAADAMANELGYACTRTVLPGSAPGTQPLAGLGLKHDKLRVIEQLMRELEVIESYL